jgi:hypothetical protein
MSLVELKLVTLVAIGTAPFFFLWKMVIKKVRGEDKPWKLYTWLATVATSPIVYVTIIAIWFFGVMSYPRHSFTKEKWAENIEQRFELSASLIDNEILIGKTKEEVKRILGDEDNNYFSDSWTYYLGFVPAIANIDPDFLVVEFKNGVVVSVSQH